MSSERKQIGSYRVIRTLGSGGMGVVYEAQHMQISRRVAIKLLHTDLLQQHDVAERFLNEARAVNEINHPGVIRIFDADKLEDGTLYLVMELLSGHTLSEYLLHKKTMPMSVMLDVAQQLAESLRAAHSRQIVHRDLKPDNIMLLPDLRRVSSLRTKILDFGIAKLTLALGGGKTVADYLGTPKYSSPEQIQNPASVDEKADVYSLGCILYECAAGAPPFDAETPFELMWKQLHDTPARLNTMAAHIGVELADLIEAMLHKDRSARPNMDQVLAALREVRDRCSLQTVVRLDPPLALPIPSPAFPSAEYQPVLSPGLGSREPILTADHSIGFDRPSERPLRQMMMRVVRQRWRFVALGGVGMAVVMWIGAGLLTLLSSGSSVRPQQMVQQEAKPVATQPAIDQEDGPSVDHDATAKDEGSRSAESSERNAAKKPRRHGKAEPVSVSPRKSKHARGL